MRNVLLSLVLIGVVVAMPFTVPMNVWSVLLMVFGILIAIGTLGGAYDHVDDV